MSTKQECDAYAVAAVGHFDAFTEWAIANWPDQKMLLTADDFRAGRRELSALLGARLDAAHDGKKAAAGKDPVSSTSVGPADASEQYINMNPSPWP